MPDTPEAHLLVAEDEPDVLELLSASLRFAGFQVTACSTGRDVLLRGQRTRPDLVILDVMLPDVDGFQVAERLRASGSRVPILFLTARGAVDDRVAGLTVGDDYVVKPFSLDEVTARIRALLRRSRPTPTSASLRIADLVLDDDAHLVTRAGRTIELSPTEFKLLRYLMANVGRVLSKAQILEHVWNYDFQGDGGIVESYMSLLRRKVEIAEPPLLHTVRGVGYVARLPPE